MKQRLFGLIAMLITLTMLLTGCSGAMRESGPGAPGAPGGGYHYGAADGKAEAGEAADGVLADAPEEGKEIDDAVTKAEEKPTIPAGQLTAAAYFDREHLSFFKGLVGTNQEGAGLFHGYYSKQELVRVENALEVTITGARNARVTLFENELPTFITYTDAGGRCTLLAKNADSVKSLAVEYTSVDGSKATETVVLDAQNAEQVYSIQGTAQKVEKIELMFVIDTTGSMGDEISYLKAEIDDVIGRVKAANPNAEILLALMFYRDQGDDYVTRYFDFTTDISAQKIQLALQSANGGGDFAEAVDTALLEAASKQWTSADSTKLLVHVADAPAHEKDLNTWMQAIKALTEKGIHVISVASSGIDQHTECMFRLQSLYSGGCYVYLTDNSGIGGSHLEATVAVKPTVEYLNSLLVRLINGYHTGVFTPAVDYRQEQK